jgi:hypothetical protein
MNKIKVEDGNIFMLCEDRAKELGFELTEEQILKLRDDVFFKSETNEMIWIWREEGYYYLVDSVLDNIINRFFGKRIVQDNND